MGVGSLLREKSAIEAKPSFRGARPFLAGAGFPKRLEGGTFGLEREGSCIDVRAERAFATCCGVNLAEGMSGGIFGDVGAGVDFQGGRGVDFLENFWGPVREALPFQDRGFSADWWRPEHADVRQTAGQA